MFEYLRQILDEHTQLAFWLAIASVAMFISAAVAVPFFVARIPHDYFVATPRRSMSDLHPVLVWLWRIVKNSVGWLLILAGIAMLVLPGQGVLTIFAGLMLVDFYGKRRLQTWIVRRRSVSKSINWLRRRSNQPPLELPDPGDPFAGENRSAAASDLKPVESIGSAGREHRPPESDLE